MTTIAPAKAGPSADTMVSVANASLPKIIVPNLLDQKAQPAVAQPQVEAPQTPLDGDDATNGDESESAIQPGSDLGDMVAHLRSGDPGSHQVECLATGVYFESKGEPLAGQLAVAKVIANRANSGGRFPSTYCGVLFQRGQFSFVHGHSLPSVSHANKQWRTAVAIAKIVDQGLHESLVGNALFFHARYVAPAWRLKRVASIGNHIFYR